MKKWVYRSEFVQGDSYLVYVKKPEGDGGGYTETWEPIDKLGAEGWEIISVANEGDNEDGYFRARMKKELGTYVTLSGAKLNLKTDIKIPVKQS